MRRSLGFTLASGVSGASLALAACGDGGVILTEPTYEVGGDSGDGKAGTSAGGNGAVPPGRGVGESCSDDRRCRDGLRCNADAVCEPSGETKKGDACVLGAECASGQCVERRCVAAGSGDAGADCASDADCASGLRCAPHGTSLSCVPQGAGDIGAECQASTECLAGLACLEGQCAPPPPMVPPFGQSWAGVECAKPVTTDVKAYFEVPGAEGAEEGDFFRLPFPTDVRLRAGKLDLSGFPTPGSGLFGLDPVKLYVDALSERARGFGTYPTVYFRFSGPLDFESLGERSLRFYDVTKPAAPERVYWSRFVTDGRSNYICNDFLAVRVPLGRPLAPGHTYAAFVLSEAGGKTLVGRADGKAVTRSPSLSEVLGAEAPSDPALEAAHAAFQPLRDFFDAYDGDDAELSIDNVVTATVFTVDPDVLQPMTELSAAVSAGKAPSARAWVKCQEGAASPCSQNAECGEDPPGYDEYQALVSIPVFQQGSAPYSTAADGGEVDPRKPVFKDVCASLTVPEGEVPASGWPTVVFAHGTGGSFRSHVRPEVAGVLADATPSFAVLGIDQVQHGPRRGDSDESPENLFFNFLNPAASLGNPLQGAADQLSVARFARSLDVSPETSTGAALKLDGARLFFFGHSQGSTQGSLMLPFGDDYRAAVLSGNGASLQDALRTKTEPQNIAAALPVILQDPAMRDPVVGEGVTQFHPVLSLLQHWLDPADPLSFARLLDEPLPEHVGKHVLQTFGEGDRFSPPVTLATFAIAAGLKQVAPEASVKNPFTDSLPLPVDAGYRAPEGAFTLGMRQYGAAGTDGHFVVFDNEVARADMVRFFAQAASGAPPAIGD